MRSAWRVADVRAAEQALLRTLPPGTLMGRAAAGLAARVAALLADRYGGRYGRHALLLVGSGDNGGDALYAGALLARRGVAVTALALVPDRAHPGGVAALRAAGGRVLSTVDGRLPAGTARVDVVLDGVTGIGGTGPLRGAAASAVAALRAAVASDGGPPITVAVDLPSGVQADTGEVPGAAVCADVTVTFGCLKPGLLVGAGARYAGLVDLVDIGLEPYLRGAPALRVAEAGDIARWWPRPEPGSDKYTRGVVGLATGSPGYPGAAVLSVAGALAGPAGLVRYAGGAAAGVLAAYPSVIASGRVGDTGRVQAWVTGCGMGTDERAAATLRAVLAAPVPACLDADALTLLVDGGFATALRTRDAPVVVTPHDREYARLVGRDPGGDRIDAAAGLAAHLGGTVLLKGDRTVVAGADGQVWVNPTGTPDLATGGTGDVLAGLLGALLAAGLAPVPAAVSAAFVHGLAGRAAARGGPVTAPAVAAALRPVLASLLTR